jgi:hypothetical protein
LDICGFIRNLHVHRPLKFDVLQVLHDQQFFSVQAQQIIEPYIFCTKIQVKGSPSQKEYLARATQAIYAITPCCHPMSFRGVEDISLVWGSAKPRDL